MTIPTSLSISGIPIQFQDDWDVGIGGGLWSTGRALSHYWNTQHAVQCLRRMLMSSGRPLRIIELGSGNGVLAVCLVRSM